MPSLGADMDAGTITSGWSKPGDRVHRGDIVAVVDTDKADVDVEIFEDGVIDRILVPEGEKVPVGTPLATLTASRRTPVAAPAARPMPEPEPAPPPEPVPPPNRFPHPARNRRPFPNPHRSRKADRAPTRTDALSGPAAPRPAPRGRPRHRHRQRAGRRDHRADIEAAATAGTTVEATSPQRLGRRPVER